MLRNRGFTLVEIVLAVTIMLLLVLLAVPSFTGLSANRRLQKTLDDLGSVVRTAREKSYSERRPYLVVVDGNKFVVRPEAMNKEETEQGGGTTFVLKSASSIKISFPAALRKQLPAEWIFWPTGTCEPAVVEFTGRDGHWIAKYSGLASEPRLTTYAAR